MAGKIKGCTHYPTKLVTKAATGGIMTVPQQATNSGVQPYTMPAQPTNTAAQQRAQAAKDNYGSIASQYMAKAAARRAAPAAVAPAYKKTNMADLEKRYGLNQAPPPAPTAAAAQPAGQVQREGPPQGSGASRNYGSTAADRIAQGQNGNGTSKFIGPPVKPKGFTGLKDMFDGGGPGASKAKAGVKASPTKAPSNGGTKSFTSAPTPSAKYSANDKKGNAKGSSGQSKSGSSGGSASKGRDKSR